MARSVTSQSVNVNNCTPFQTRLRRSLIVATMLVVLIIGAIGYSLFDRWTSLRGGPEMAPGGCPSCHQGPALGSISLDFITATA